MFRLTSRDLSRPVKELKHALVLTLVCHTRIVFSFSRDLPSSTLQLSKGFHCAKLQHISVSAASTADLKINCE